jgi:hypothetical protein
MSTPQILYLPSLTETLGPLIGVLHACCSQISGLLLLQELNLWTLSIISDHDSVMKGDCPLSYLCSVFLHPLIPRP